jgi:membrane fusion protein (multidrug efflux system)
MLMVIDVIRARRRALLVPEEAIVPIRDKTFVYVVGANRRARRVVVRLGMRRPGMVEIRAGLKPGARVVVEGTSRLRPGARVRVTRTVVPGGGS